MVYIIILTNKNQHDHLHIDGRNGDVSDNPELAAVVQMLVLQPEKVPNKPEDENRDNNDKELMTIKD